MMMIVDTHGANREFSVLVEELSQLGDSIGTKIKLQHEQIFDMMHRI
jgi:ACT domain-containing protein